MAAISARGRAAKTEYRVVVSGKDASLIECQLHSGRTHQIRVHLRHLGHPVLGDKLYGPKFAKNFPRQMLHGWKLGFQHPCTGDWRSFEAPLPEDFRDALRAVEIAAALEGNHPLLNPLPEGEERATALAAARRPSPPRTRRGLG